MAMTESLLSTVKDLITPDFMNKASGLLDESPEKSKPGLFSAIPTILGGVIHKGSTQEGARDLIRSIKEDGYDLGVPTDYKERLGVGNSDHYLRMGSSALNGIFGGKLGAVTSAFSGATGLRAASSTKLLGLVAPLVMGTVGSKIKDMGLNPSSLMGFLGQEKASLKGLLPSGIGDALGYREEPPEVHAREDAPPRRLYAERRTGRNGLPLVLLAIIAAFGVWYLRRPRVADFVSSPHAQAQRGAAQAPAQAPNAVQNDTMSRVLDEDSTARLPQRMISKGIHFNPGTSELTADSRPAITAIAGSLKQHPHGLVRIEGYTDNTGSPEANRTLSSEQAKAVEDALVDQGVPGDQIQAVGMGEAHPIAPNRTPAGRAENRRTEVIILRR